MDERPIGVLNFFRHWPQTNVLFDQAQQQLPIDGTGCIDSESKISFNDSDLSEGLQPISIDCETMWDRSKWQWSKRWWATNGNRLCYRAKNNYFPNSELSWYSISSSQNVPIAVKLSSLNFYNKLPRMGKKPAAFPDISQLWETEKNNSQTCDLVGTPWQVPKMFPFVWNYLP